MTEKKKRLRMFKTAHKEELNGCSILIKEFEDKGFSWRVMGEGKYYCAWCHLKFYETVEAAKDKAVLYVLKNKISHK